MTEHATEVIAMAPDVFTLTGALDTAGILLAVAALSLTTFGIFSAQSESVQDALPSGSDFYKGRDRRDTVKYSATEVLKAGILFMVAAVGALAEAAIPESLWIHPAVDDSFTIGPALFLGLIYLAKGRSPFKALFSRRSPVAARCSVPAS